ncbi:hypothetical protein NM208_g16753 [Fusarium decemcellulare]|uniref:Uncharacterized protein n=1 Tax=Fusarium decemcellulare TaxID=57161 RepID=A0ACC1R9F1_9HYPO|nr:hypothetical protein NM208_g16753 [Fusarium decemcellulare]
MEHNAEQTEERQKCGGEEEVSILKEGALVVVLAAALTALKAGRDVTVFSAKFWNLDQQRYSVQRWRVS